VTGGTELGLACSTVDELEADVAADFDVIFRLDSVREV
jgi:hypothetical protein